MAIVIALTGVFASLGGRAVLEDVSFDVAAGQVVALCGPNGAGKTSVLRAALGGLKIERGSIAIGGERLEALSDRQRAERLAYLAQDRRIAWNMAAVEIVMLGLPFLDAEQARARAVEALNEVDAASLADRGVAEMSGGERARVLIARTLVTGAAALALDEPVAGLDPDAQFLVMDRLRARASAGQAILVSLHDLDLAARYADRIAVMKDGRVIADAAPVEALSPDTLDRVFGIRGAWVEGPFGPVLAVSRSGHG